MSYDLNIPWSPAISPLSLERMIIFLSDLGYQTLALTYTQSDHNLTSKHSNPIPTKFTFDIPSKVTILRRCTIVYSDPAQNHRLPSISPLFDILAIRPTNEKAFLASCTTVTEHSIISLDLTIRYPFHFKPKPLMTAIKRGTKIEISYGQCINADAVGRKNFISNTMSIVRCTRGRGLIVSSEAGNVVACRGIQDLVNLLGVWGLSKEKAFDGLQKNPREVVVNEGIKRTGFRGVIDVIDGGLEFISAQDERDMKSKGKRPIDKTNPEGAPSTNFNLNKKCKVNQTQ
ncbi:putative ribonuclease P protein subunit 3 [Erysiphe neolycopersici]|uniref:Putative ribonuclease P protein subunit 3 n=1 Tax=Erysiphe neolycopersici TaxID=212602 RepID=A0A420HC97_9PEZI|nr:putative ribonuclease P protein subunit 3 [Erysiphe neolycopersici]